MIFVKDPYTISDVGFFLSAIDHKNAPVEHMQKMATHALEDTIAHELGHHIFHNNYVKQINKECEEQDEVIFDPSHLTILDEAFARWFNEAVVGHEHISSPLIQTYDNEVYRRLISRPQDVPLAYLFLRRQGQEKGIKGVCEHFANLAVNFLTAYAKDSS